MKYPSFPRFVMALVLITLPVVFVVQGQGYGEPRETIGALAWSPDANRIAYATFEPSLVIVDVNPPSNRLVLQGSSMITSKIDWSPDGSRLATGGYDEQLRIWDTQNGQLLATIDLSDQDERPSVILWSRDGERVITGATGGNVYPRLRAWDVSTGTIVSELEGYDAYVAHWSPDGTKLAISGITQLRLLDAETLAVEQIFEQPGDFENGFQVNAFAWADDGQSIAVGYLNRVIRIWDVTSGTVIDTFQASEIENASVQFSFNYVQAIRYMADQARLVSVTLDGTLRGWDITTGQMIVNQVVAIPLVYSADFSLLGGRIALGGIPIEAPDNQISMGVANDTGLPTDTLEIVVADPSSETLQAITDACGLQPAADQALTAEISAQDYAGFTTQLEALPEDALPPGCRADLLAIATALAAQGG